MKKQHLFLYRLFLAISDTQQSEDDVIMDLTVIAFDRVDLREMSYQVWW